MRYAFIDIARGIAILLVVLGHCCSSASDPLNKMILSFHMPLFFLLSGLFVKIPERKCVSIFRGVLSKCERLLVPHLLLSLTIIILNGLLWVADGKSISEFDFGSCFMYWFLLVLFVCSIALMIIGVFFDLDNIVVKITIICMSICLIIVSLRVGEISRGLYWVKIVPTAFLYFVSGFFLRKRVIEMSEEKTPTVLKEILLLLLVPLLYIISQLNAPVKMYENNYGIYPLFLITSFIGIYLVLVFSKRIGNSLFLEEMGKLSIAVYVWNFLIVGLVHRVFSRALSIWDIDNGVISAITFIVSVLVLYAMGKSTYYQLPWLYGAKKTHRY